MDRMYQQGLGGQRVVYHFVWGVMRGRPVLIDGTARRLTGLLREKAVILGIDLALLDIQPDHVCLAVEAPPTLSPHRIACGLKSYSSSILRQEFRCLTALPTLWATSYLVVAGRDVGPDELRAAWRAAQIPRRPRGRPRCGPAAPHETPASKGATGRNNDNDTV